jgi:LmbE family N-acetylglucosaminyl deacetylase
MSEGDGLTILGIGAHPSDAFANIGGTLANHVRRGDKVVILSLTYGLQHLSDKLIGRSVAEIKRLIEAQTAEASALLGISDSRILDFGDSPLVSTRERLLELGQIIREIRPDVVISAHHPQGGVDHGESARMVERAPSYISHGAETSTPPHAVKMLYHCMLDVLYPLNGPVLSVPDTYVDISDTLELKIRAYTEIFMRYSSVDARAHAAKIRAVHRYLGVAAGVEYAEPFAGSRPRAAVLYLTT